MSSITLSSDLIAHFNISDYSPPKKGGQKTVFIVNINNVYYALKVINIADARFEREVKICEKYSNLGGIPKILRIEKFETDTIILEEYIAGEDLCDIYKSFSGDEKGICDLLFKVGRILKPIWEDGYVHRDLKPQNIRIREDGNPVVLDFGIARALDEDSITATGMQPASWLFASPEQYAGKKELISYRTDFFCMGIIAFFLFEQELPFGRNKDEIDATFQQTSISVSSRSDIINKFCNSVFKIAPSERPRKIGTFLNSLVL